MSWTFVFYKHSNILVYPRSYVNCSAHIKFWAKFQGLDYSFGRPSLSWLGVRGRECLNIKKAPIHNIWRYLIRDYSEKFRVCFDNVFKNNSKKPVLNCFLEQNFIQEIKYEKQLLIYSLWRYWPYRAFINNVKVFKVFFIVSIVAFSTL